MNKKLRRITVKPMISGCLSHAPSVRCQNSFQNPYKVPDGSPQREIVGECGTGCFCLDKDIPTDAMDKLNLTRNITGFSLCSGSHENTDRNPWFYLAYTGRNRNRMIQNLRPLCSVAKIKVDDRSRRTFEDPCGDKNYSELETNEVRKHSGGYYKDLPEGSIGVSIDGKIKNSAEWWRRIASSLTNL